MVLNHLDSKAPDCRELNPSTVCGLHHCNALGLHFLKVAYKKIDSLKTANESPKKSAQLTCNRPASLTIKDKGFNNLIINGVKNTTNINYNDVLKFLWR